MRFSIWPNLYAPWSEVVELTRHCEAAGWDGVYYADHFMPNTADGSPADGAVYECWSMLSALAASVPRLRLGTLVSGNTYRHPAVLAKMAATLDHISGGRFVLGLGAGWQVNEHEAYGIPLFGKRERLDRFEEACAMITSLLRTPRTTFAGKYYQLRDAPCDPKPVQERMPLLLGAKGKQRSLNIVAHYADEWNMWSWPELLREHRDVLLGYCDEIARDPAEISVSTQAEVTMWDGTGTRPDPGPGPGARPAVIGTVSEVIDTIAAYRDAGAGEFIVPDWNMGTLARRKDTLDHFITGVAPAFR